ncbi:MAG: hypothetical protein JWN86_1188 [Planctomycetota bacterium]|nr:hypothetical protein [Planctomycetota bacterium]
MNSRTFSLRRTPSPLAVLMSVALSAVASRADEKPAPAKPSEIKHTITGLCCREREDDLRAAAKKMMGVTLLSVDFENSEATFAYDPATLFPQEKPERFIELFDNLLKSASTHTFGVKAPSRLPRDKLTLIEIPVLGLDCKGCCLGTYHSIYRIEGVERATASFKECRVTALIDPAKTNRAALEKALKDAGVMLKEPGK